MTEPFVGMRARFFHPRTMGVMLWGTVVKVEPDQLFVKFDVDGKTYATYRDYVGYREGSK